MSKREQTVSFVFARRTPVHFRCPVTDIDVESDTFSGLDIHHSGYGVVGCPSCGGGHMVDPRTGKILSEEN